MCVLSLKVPIRKKSGNLLNDPRIYIYIYILVHVDCYGQVVDHVVDLISLIRPNWICL